MKLEIYNEPQQDKPMLLRLQKGNGCVILSVVDEDAPFSIKNDLLSVHDDGTIHLSSSVDPAFGFQLANDGHVVTRTVCGLLTLDR